MKIFESHLRLIGLISPYLKLNLDHLGLFSPSMPTLFGTGSDFTQIYVRSESGVPRRLADAMVTDLNPLYPC
jgi:hypothetical protein